MEKPFSNPPTRHRTDTRSEPLSMHQYKVQSHQREPNHHDPTETSHAHHNHSRDIHDPHDQRTPEVDSKPEQMGRHSHDRTCSNIFVPNGLIYHRFGTEDES
ncbi:hypothetical protein V6Z11_D02G024900 [Gossypium hirsutum]